MQAQVAIAILEKQLGLHGQDVTFRRYLSATGSPRPKTEAVVRAFIRPLKAEEMVGDIDAKYSHVTISPEAVSAFLPIVKNDKIVLDGGIERNVEFPKPLWIGSELVRIDLIIGG